MRRLLVLVAVAVITYFLQKEYEQNHWIWAFVIELSLYVFLLGSFVSQQTGRLKSGPDSGAVTYEQLVDYDSSVQVYIALYVFFLMVAIVARVIIVGPIEDVWMGPWGLFLVFAPIFVIVWWQQYRLEASRELTRE